VILSWTRCEGGGVLIGALSGMIIKFSHADAPNTEIK
jgi:hypothetical protein